MLQKLTVHLEAVIAAVGGIRLHLAGKHTAVRGFAVIQRLYSERVAGCKQDSRFVVVYQEREHTAQHSDKTLAVGTVKLAHRFHLGVGGEHDALFFKRFSQLKIIVNFAVIDHGISSVRRRVRLGAVFKVNDGKTAKCKRNASLCQNPVLIGSAVRDEL